MTREVIPGGQRRKVSIWTHSHSTTFLVLLATLLTTVSTYRYKNENVGKYTLDKTVSPNVLTPPSENWEKIRLIPIPTNPKFPPFSQTSTTPKNPIPFQEPENSKESSATEETSTSVEFLDLQKSSSGDKQLKTLSLPLNRDTAFAFRFPSFSPEVDDSLGGNLPVGPLSILNEFERHHFLI